MGGSLADPRDVIPLLARLEALLSASDGGALDYVLEADALAKALSAEEVAGVTSGSAELRLRGGTGAATDDHRAAGTIGHRWQRRAPGGRPGAAGALLADGDGEALETALAAQSVAGVGAFGARETDALLREVGNFDFDAALIRVRGLSALRRRGAHRGMSKDMPDKTILIVDDTPARTSPPRCPS